MIDLNTKTLVIVICYLDFFPPILKYSSPAKRLVIFTGKAI